MAGAGKVACSILFTAVIALVSLLQYRKEKRFFVISLVVTMVLANGAAGAAFFLFRNRYTVFEYLALGAVAAAFFARLVFPAILKKRIEADDVLSMLCIVALAVVAYSCLTLGQVRIHSDTSHSTLLAQSIAEHRSLFPAQWSYRNGEIWFLASELPVMIPSLLMRNQPMARMIGSLIYVLAASAAVFGLSRRTFKDHSWSLAIPILMLCIFGQRDHMLYQASYTGQIIWIALCGLLLYEIYQRTDTKKLNRYYFIYAGLMVCLTMGGMRILAEQTMPALLAVFFTFWIRIRKKEGDDRKNIRSFFYMAAGICVPTVIGYGIYKWLCRWHNMNYSHLTGMTFVGSIEEIWDNLWTMVRNMFTCFGFNGSVKLTSVYGARNLVSLVLCLLVVFIVPALQLRKLEEEPDSVKLFVTYGMCHNLILVVYAVLFGLTPARYMLTTVFVSVIISARYIYAHWIRPGGYRSFIWVLLFFIAIGAECAGTMYSSRGWTDTMNDLRTEREVFLSRGLTKGYATYWNSYVSTIYSDFDVRFAPIIFSDEGLPLKRDCLIDSDIFEPEDGPTFLFLSTSERNALSDELDAYLGEPVEVFQVPHHYHYYYSAGGYSDTVETFWVYVYDHDIAEDMTFSLSDGIMVPRQLETEENAELRTSSIALAAGSSVLTPETELPVRQYTYTIEGSGLDHCGFDVLTESADAVEWYPEYETDDTVVLRLILSEEVNDLAVRITNESASEEAAVNIVQVGW